MQKRKPRHPAFTHTRTAACGWRQAVGLWSGAVALLAATAAQAAPALSFSAYAQEYGYLNTSYTSPLLGGSINVNINGASDYKGWWTGMSGTGTGVAQAQYTVSGGQGGQDPLYDLFTENGRYSFSYQGQAEVTGTHLHTGQSSATLDNGAPTESAGNTSMWSTSAAGWSQQFYIGPQAGRPAGAYGAILMAIQLDGQFNALSSGMTNNGSAQLTASTSFVDTAGVSYLSSYSVYTNAQDSNWSGSSGLVYKKLLFQYGTAFNVNFSQYLSVGNNGDADFTHTGKIVQIEIPFGATLETGAGQAGLGSQAELYGQVFQSASADAENTNWDFGNNGGGFTPNVPEPNTWALALAGLWVVGAVRRRR